ncbi:MAG: type II secretion system minor pseudopilin GspJ [Oceanobacter sp.]
MMGKQKRLCGFTLLEVLVAVAITASIGAGAVQLLRSVSDARQAVIIRSEQLAVLQRFNELVSRDVEQFINRPIRDAYGDEIDSLLLNSGDYLLEFTRAGWRNRPGVEDPRSELMRVAYRLESIQNDDCEVSRRRLADWGVDEPELDCLVRYVWPVLDRGYDSTPRAMVVLDQVETLEVELITRYQANETETSQQTGWPVSQNADNLEIPLAMQWKLELPVLGEVERLWLIAHDGEDL